jgi:Contractile injection system tube protein
VPNVIPFQYNPEKLSHTLTPWNPFEVDQTQRGSQAPTVQPFDPKESFNLTLEIDATDDLEDNNPVAKRVGVADQLAALKKLTLPTEGLIGDLIASARALVGKAAKHAVRSTVPVLLFVWGSGRILPVRVTSFSVEETLFSPSLHPIQATVTLGLEVLTPDVFKCQHDITADIAVAAYNFTKLQEDTLAAAHIANNIDAIRGLLPF